MENRRRQAARFDLFVIFHFPFSIYHFPFVIRHSSFVIFKATHPAPEELSGCDWSTRSVLAWSPCPLSLAWVAQSSSSARCARGMVTSQRSDPKAGQPLQYTAWQAQRSGATCSTG